MPDVLKSSLDKKFAIVIRLSMIKKVSAFISTITFYLLAMKNVLAQETNTTITINKPPVGYNDLGLFITNVIRLVFIIAAIGVLIMLVWGALEWIFSGGEKEAVGKARGRILNALIGLAILAVAVAVASVAGTFTGVDLFKFTIPTPPPAGR